MMDNDITDIDLSEDFILSEVYYSAIEYLETIESEASVPTTTPHSRKIIDFLAYATDGDIEYLYED